MIHQWGVDSDTGVLRDVLLCRPDHYRWLPANAVAIDTLKRGAAFDPAAAQAQHAEMAQALAEAGVRCHWLEPDPHLPYQIYTRDSSVVTSWGVIVAQLFRPQRRGEYAAVLDFYRDAGIPVWKMATAAALEGGDLHMPRPGLMVLGYTGERTQEPAAQQCASWFEAQGWTVRLVPFAEHFLHLDVLFCMVAEGLAVACTDVLDEDLLAWLRGDERIELIPVDYRETMRLGCNVLALGGGRVMSPRHAAGLNARLRAHGLSVIDPDVELFAMGGGGIRCMTMPLRRDPAG
jgi:N-dimethylarginine dimethylaminohydrolase